MSWRYTPETNGPRITHPEGTTPPRPLEVGDYVTEHNGTRRYVQAVSPGTLQLDDTAGRRRVVHRAPTEGDMSGVITEVPAVIGEWPPLGEKTPRYTALGTTPTIPEGGTK